MAEIIYEAHLTTGNWLKINEQQTRKHERCIHHQEKAIKIGFREVNRIGDFQRKFWKDKERQVTELAPQQMSMKNLVWGENKIKKSIYQTSRSTL